MNTTSSNAKKIPQVGFISLGCPKATVDSEHILTRLRAEGYLISSSYQDSDLVSVKPSRKTARLS
jgi:ribosomal protein S12 methylthiotransferase